MSAVPPIAATSLAAAPPSPARELWRDFRRNRGAVIGLAVLGLLVFCALFADVISPYDPSEQFRDATLRPPSLAPVGGHIFVLGTDPVGRDIVSRLIHGTRLSLVIGLVSVGLQIGTLFAGAILTETIFAWPGVGKWLVEAIHRRDYAAVQGGILCTATIIIGVNLIVDVLYGVINPRIRHA